VDEYLTAKFKDKELVKSLGARYDGPTKQWYVPDGLDLTPFLAWLPAARKMQLATSTTSSTISFPATQSNPSAMLKKGISLSQLLAGVSQAIAQTYAAGVWTMVEVISARVHSNGTVYLEISERDANGSVIAKSGAVIWSSNASRILPEFEKATGAVIGPGVKLLVRAKPVFKPAHGFSIEIDAIDPQYTLGDLEGRKRDIRARLHRELVFNANKKLTPPWDFAPVLVIAPPDAAGLGDFRAEANRLERHGVCKFVYVHSRFQGEGAAAEIRKVLMHALEKWGSMPKIPDPVVIIRGGGAVNDLAWLNDYDLARCICELEIPVFTGVGHERDSTVLDEVAHSKFDTPGKVIGEIERIIRMRAQESKENFEQIARMAGHAATTARRAVVHSDEAIKSSASRLVVLAWQQSSVLMAQLQRESARTVRVASESA
jgi:exodeoxyribonuclease VII large subunit